MSHLVRALAAHIDNVSTPGRRQSKTSILSMNVDQKSLKTVFDCHLWPDWWQMAIKNTVSSDFYLRLSIVKSIFDCRLPGVVRK